MGDTVRSGCNEPGATEVPHLWLYRVNGNAVVTNASLSVVKSVRTFLDFKSAKAICKNTCLSCRQIGPSAGRSTRAAINQ